MYYIFLILGAFRTAYPRITERDFEFTVMEWFRFANVRTQKKH